MTSPQACGRAATAPVSPSGPSPCSIQPRSPARAVRRRHIEPQRIGRAGFEQARSLVRRQRFRRCPDRAARHRDRAATAPSASRCATSLAISARLSKRGIDQALRREFFQRVRDSRQDARIAAAPAFPRRCRARRGLRRSRPRIPACSAWRRCPRCAAATGRRSRAPDRNSAAPNRRGRDADSRSGSAQSGKRVAALSESRHGRACPGHPRLATRRYIGNNDVPTRIS